MEFTFPQIGRKNRTLKISSKNKSVKQIRSLFFVSRILHLCSIIYAICIPFTNCQLCYMDEGAEFLFASAHHHNCSSVHFVATSPINLLS